MSAHMNWPVLTRYDQNHLRHIALPLGGIGTGTVSLGGRGNLFDWEIVNRPAKSFQLKHTFFALYAHTADGHSFTRALEGAISADDYEGARGALVPNHGLPRFRNCMFEAAYPFGQVILSDPDVPLHVRLEAFNPLIPGDADSSSIPVAVLRYVLTNPTSQPVSASVCGSLQNFIGADGTHGSPKSNVNSYRENGVRGILMRSDGVDPLAEQWGTLALATTAQSGVTYRTTWANYNWGDSLLDYWDDFSEDGKLEDRDQEGVDSPIGSLAVSVDVPAGSTQTVTFLLAWHFPNRQTWNAPGINSPSSQNGGENHLGNYYTTLYTNAWDVAVRTAADLERLEVGTMAFVGAVADSDLPEVVKEAALYNLSTLRSQTTFRTADGYIYGWEGCDDIAGCCFGSCTHVWNYEQATAFLFGDLSVKMREVEFLYMTRSDGGMSFRVNLPLKYASTWSIAAADGQMGCIMKLYRDWQLSGDDAMLRQMWPNARKTLEFCWVRGGWDADKDGVMEGCQHNTMDVEYYGPNPQMEIWYLGALRSAEEMARYIGETEFAEECRRLFEYGRGWTDQHLFNGDYYEHEIRPAASADSVFGMLLSDMGAKDPTDPVLQLGSGCLVDQLVGQFMAHVCGLGYLVDPGNVQQTLRSIMKYNFKENMFGHFNHMRSYVLNDESALLMATYPRGNRPKRPFPYYNEVMTGFEYAAAIGMLYEGQLDSGLRSIQAVRDRYDGRKRSPFNEAECGHHYARAMASWAAILALTGFQYSGVDQSMTFAHTGEVTQTIWSNGYAWGIFKQQPDGDSVSVELQVLGGDLTLKQFTLAGYGSIVLDAPTRIKQGEHWSQQVRPS